jgi:hypothetical protein
VPEASITVALQGSTNGQHNVRVTLNGTLLGNMQFISTESYSRTFVIPTSLLVDGANSLQLDTTTLGDFAWVDKTTVNYAKLYKASLNQATFPTLNLKETRVPGFDSPNIRVFDITDTEPKLLFGPSVVANGATFDAVIPSGRPRLMYAVADTGLLSPVAITQNIPSTISQSPRNTDMIILSHKNFINEANTWANYRRGQGLTVDVFDVEDVYDEFDFGSPSTNAITALARHARDTWTIVPKYLLLVGDATYDPRNYENRPVDHNYIPSKFVDTSYRDAASDEALGDLNNDAVSEIPIGRLPVRDAATIGLLLNKVTTFEQTVSTALMTRGALFVADGPNGYDFVGVNTRLRAFLPTAMPATFINRTWPGNTTTDNAGRTQIIAAANNGPFLVNYSGHGSAGIWATSSFFSLNEVPQINGNSNSLSMYLMLTCLNGFFVSTTNESLAELLFKSSFGGGAMAWSSTALTTPDIQEIMASKFFLSVGQGTFPRIGEAIRDSKLNAPNRDVPYTWVLIGDPALKIR